MILAVLNDTSGQAALRYRLVIEAFRALYGRTVSSPRFGRGAIEDAMGEANALMYGFYDSERSHIETAIIAVSEQAHLTTLYDLQSSRAKDIAVVALSDLGQSETYLVDELSAQLTRDLTLLRQKLNGALLEISLASKSRNIPERSAQIEFRISNAAEIQFTFRDRASRVWESEKFVRTLWRHTLLSVYNEEVLTVLADHDVTRAQVYHQDHKADVDGLIIAFGSNSDLPTYSEIRDAVFHPNANAYLRPEPVNVQT